MSLLVRVNVNDFWLTEAATILNYRIGRLPFVYLGLPVGGDVRHIHFWDPLLNRIQTRPSGRKSKNLSLDGRLVLLKFVLSSLSVYVLSFFKAPSCIIFSIESLVIHFFLGRM